MVENGKLRTVGQIQFGCISLKFVMLHFFLEDIFAVEIFNIMYKMCSK